MLAGALPEEWKLAHVTPIYKNKGAQNLAVNYRPVSLTSIICKLMESIIREHITKHLVNLKLFQISNMVSSVNDPQLHNS